MNKKPLIPQSVEHWTLDQLFERSLDELRKQYGVPKVIEAEIVREIQGDTLSPREVTEEEGESY